MVLVPLAIVAAILLIAMMFRTVVETNRVHIVQSRKQTISYGTGQAAGNVYYNWPSKFPVIGITRIILPVSNFDLPLHQYKAYDKDRVPFELDVVAFFRIKDTNHAAERVSNFDDLKHQLLAIVQGAVRKILASHDINQIMVDRATFGQQFTVEVATELANWGVEPVKNMELMDIRDADGSAVIANIMAMKASHIEMSSRTEVARNKQEAETAEINARQVVEVRRQHAEQAVGERTAEKDKAVGIATQKAAQEVKVEEAATREKEMIVIRVQQVRQAEITRDQQVVAAEQDRQTRVIMAEGNLEATKRHAEGVRLEGEAKGAAEQAMQMAPVNAQIALAEKIAELEGYQQYLTAIKAIEAHVAVGSKQAEALKAADIKVIANTGKPTEGVSSVMDLFTSKGGTDVAAMVEAVAQSPLGKAALEKLGIVAQTPEKRASTGNGQAHS